MLASAKQITWNEGKLHLFYQEMKADQLAMVNSLLCLSWAFFNILEQLLHVSMRTT